MSDEAVGKLDSLCDWECPPAVAQKGALALRRLKHQNQTHSLARTLREAVTAHQTEGSGSLRARTVLPKRAIGKVQFVKVAGNVRTSVRSATKPEAVRGWKRRWNTPRTQLRLAERTC